MFKGKSHPSIIRLHLPCLFRHSIRQASDRAQELNTNDQDAWVAYWRVHGQPWRTEPEIDKKRREYLAHRRTIAPNIEQGIYPFKNVKLNRADIEWLLATHENGLGPVDWTDKSQRERKGLDMRGADLRGVDLRFLPLARLRSGLNLEWSQWPLRTLTVDRFWQAAAIHLEKASLDGAHLEGAVLRDAHLEEAILWRTHLVGAVLPYAHLEGAGLPGAYLQQADLRYAHLEGANLYMVHLEGANLRGAHLEGAVLENMFLADEKYVGPLLADAEWGSDNLSVVKWSQVHMLGDEYRARQKKLDGKIKESATIMEEYETAVRANRQIAIVLQAQGLNEDAARFAYHAQYLQRTHWWLQKNFGKYLFSLFLSLIAGYGYKLWRSFATYVLVIVGFAIAYYLLGPAAKHPLSLLDAIIFSMTSFHGRGFSPGDNIGLSNPLTILAAIEAFVGLVIEVTLIATLTQRFFNK